MQNRSILTVCKGAIVGGTMLVPGVSGGTMAMILGIYDQLVHAVASFRRQPRQNGLPAPRRRRWRDTWPKRSCRISWACSM